MSKPINIPSRSKSVPRTNNKIHLLQVHSDSQVTYRSLSGEKSTGQSRRLSDGDDSGGSCDYYDEMGTFGGTTLRKQKRKKSVKLSRSKRISRSFAAASGVNAENAGLAELRRCSNPAEYNRKVIHNKDIGVGSVTCPANSVTAALLLAHHTLKLSCPLLPMELKPPIPAPLVVEDPPSSDNASDLEEDTVRYNLDPVFLNGSSSSFGSAGGTTSGCVGGARSAPSTPHGVVSLGSAGVAVASAGSGGGSVSGGSYGTTGGGSSTSFSSSGGGTGGGGSSGEPHSQPCSPSYAQTTIPKSPSHVFTKYDKGSLKQLSSSAPVMTAQTRSLEPPSPKGAKAEKMPAGSSKARQKKFHRHFTQVDDEERVLNYYSCALVGDILLQGHLYITKNYFAFYSNVFGYVTKLLIPITSVMKISKEKTARIIPNAVGVATADDKHVFGSLLSRDSTYKLMMMVLKAANSVEAVATLPVPKDIRPGELDASEISCEDETSSQSGNDSPTLRVSRRAQHAGIIPTITKLAPEKSLSESIKAATIPLTSKHVHDGVITTGTRNLLTEKFSSSPFLAKYNVFLLVMTLLLILLFASAGVLLYRISRIQTKYSIGLQDSMIAPTNEIYNEILHWQSQLHTKSAGAVHNFLDSNLDQIAKVRKSLEALSTLLMPNNPSSSQAQAPEHRSEVPPETNKPQAAAQMDNGGASPLDGSSVSASTS